MILQVQQLIATMDNKINLIESNKTANCEKEIIIRTNAKLLKELNSCIDHLKFISCNKSLMVKYISIINRIELI